MSKVSQLLAKSSQMFASNIAFFSIFQNLQDVAQFCKNVCKILVRLQHFQSSIKYQVSDGRLEKRFRLQEKKVPSAPTHRSEKRWAMSIRGGAAEKF